MNIHANKTQEKKSQAVAVAIAQKQGGSEHIPQFIDNRPETVLQKKLQEMANNSPRLIQLSSFQETANKSTRTKQVVQMLLTMADTNTVEKQLPIQKKVSISGPVDYKKGQEDEVDMSELRVGNSYMWSSGFAPCVAVCAYGESEDGEKKMAFWHVDATQGDGEDVIIKIIDALGDDIKEDSISIAAVQGTDSSSQFDEIAGLEESPYPVDATAVPNEPELPEDDDWWDVEVYMNTDESVEYATPTSEDY